MVPPAFRASLRRVTAARSATRWRFCGPLLPDHHLLIVRAEHPTTRAAAANVCPCTSTSSTSSCGVRSEGVVGRGPDQRSSDPVSACSPALTSSPATSARKLIRSALLARCHARSIRFVAMPLSRNVRVVPLRGQSELTCSGQYRWSASLSAKYSLLLQGTVIREAVSAGR